MPSFCFQRRGDVEAVVLRSRAALDLNVITNFSDFSRLEVACARSGNAFCRWFMQLNWFGSIFVDVNSDRC